MSLRITEKTDKFGFKSKQSTQQLNKDKALSLSGGNEISRRQSEK